MDKKYVKEAMKLDGDRKHYADLHMSLNQRKLRLLHACLGLSGEVGELVDTIKKHIMYGKELDTTNIEEEIGDIFWYSALLLDEMGFDPSQIAKQNIKKLRKRYKGGYSNDKAIKRADKV